MIRIFRVAKMFFVDDLQRKQNFVQTTKSSDTDPVILFKSLINSDIGQEDFEKLLDFDTLLFEDRMDTSLTSKQLSDLIG